MKNNEYKKLHINRDRVKKVIKQALSPAFLVILLGSFLLWYTTKLNYEYTTEMPLNVWIDGQKYKVTATVSGRGTSLMAQKLSLKSRVNLKLDELSTRRAEDDPDALTFTAKSLQKAINNKITDLQIVEIVEAPAFTPESKKETRKERRDRIKTEATSDGLQQTPKQEE